MNVYEVWTWGTIEERMIRLCICEDLFKATAVKLAVAYLMNDADYRIEIKEVAL